MQQILHRAGVRLLRLLPTARFFGGDDIIATACCGDWRSCRPGDLFVAMVDADHDGHDYVNEALENGAVAVLAERPLPVSVPVCVVPDTREAYGQVCHELAGQPGEKLRVVGVTGTNGKTTTGALIASVLQAKGRFVGTTGTLGYCDGIDTTPALRTTPVAPQLADCLARMAANGCDDAVVEVSSRALAQRRIAGLQFDAVVMTNLRRDHLDYHGSTLNYRAAKARLFQQLKPDGFAVVNIDDPGSRHLLDKLSCPVLTIGMQQPAELTATLVERHKSEQTFLLNAGNESIPVRTNTIGDHYIRNCLAAAAVGLVAGVKLQTVVQGLENLQGVPGRLERIECGQPFGVFVDYARTPDTLAVALKTLKKVTEGRLICVFGADAQRDPANRPLLGRVAERTADAIVLTNDNPHAQPPLQIIHDILDGFDRPAFPHIMPDRAKAIHWALQSARPGDMVLIAGKGNDDYQALGETRYAFDDSRIAKDWLYEVGAKTDYEPTLKNILKLHQFDANLS